MKVDKNKLQKFSRHHQNISIISQFNRMQNNSRGVHAIWILFSPRRDYLRVVGMNIKHMLQINIFQRNDLCWPFLTLPRCSNTHLNTAYVASASSMKISNCIKHYLLDHRTINCLKRKQHKNADYNLYFCVNIIWF